jgi:hypothetical protein
MAQLVQINGRHCLEIVVAEDLDEVSIGGAADTFLLEPSLLLGDLAEFERNRPILTAVAPTLDDLLLDASVESELSSLKGLHPHLEGETPSPLQSEPTDAPPPFPCCARTPVACVDYPLGVSAQTGTLYSAWAANPQLRWPAADEGEERQVSSPSDLEAYVRERVTAAIEGMTPEQKVSNALSLGLDPRALELPADAVLYAELPHNHLIFDPTGGPWVARRGCAT